MDRSKRELPTPVSREDVYLAALLEELEGLRADMDSARAPATVKQTVEIRGDVRAAIKEIKKNPPEPKSKRQRKKG